jgi:hypothetical protein
MKPQSNETGRSFTTVFGCLAQFIPNFRRNSAFSFSFAARAFFTAVMILSFVAL